jgi:hypothetical protein
MSVLTKASSSVQNVAPEDIGGIDRANLDDSLVRARKLMAEAVGIDSHIDTIQRIMKGENLG